jgi:DNA invertase Pin-like site-specific DNA recombinase
VRDDESRKRAAIYCRISEDPTGRAAGVERQERECRELAEARGWEVVEVYVDNDVSISSFSRQERPEYDRMLEDLKGGRFGAVVCWHSDRFYKRLRDLEHLVDVFEAADAEIATVRAGNIDLTTPTGRLVARLLGATAMFEGEHASERLRSKHAELALQGRWPGGGRPYGYRVVPGAGTLEVVPEEAAVLREAVARVLAGETPWAIARDLNARGETLVTGAPWRSPRLKQILLSPTTAGRRVHKGADVGEAVWEGVLSRADQERLRAALTDPARTVRPARSYLLTGGLAVCGRCGVALIGHARAGRTRNDGTRSPESRLYICQGGDARTGCDQLTVVADKVEELVTEMVLAALDTPGLAWALAEPDPDPASEELAVVEAKLAELADAWAADEIGKAEWLRARDGLAARQTAARARVRRRARTSALEPYRDGSLRARWPSLSLDQKRAVVAAVVQKVTIQPATRRGSGFDPSRVQVTWRS